MSKEFFPPIRGRFGLLPPENTTREILNAILVHHRHQRIRASREAGEILLRKAKAKFSTLALVHVDSAYNDTFEDAAKELGIKVEKRKKPEGKGFQGIKWSG